MEEIEKQSGVKEIKKGAGSGLIVATIFLMGAIYANGQKFSSDNYYAIFLLIVSIGAGWLHYKEKLIKKFSIVRWIVLLIISASVLGFLGVIFK